MSGATAHSHRPTTKVTHKGFKSRKATKGALREELKGADCARRPVRAPRKTSG